MYLPTAEYYSWHYYINYNMMDYPSRMRSTGVTTGNVRSARYSNRGYRECRPIYQPPHKVQNSEEYKTFRERVSAVPCIRQFHPHSNIKPPVRDRIGLKRSWEPYPPERVVIKPRKVKRTPVEDQEPEQSDTKVIKTEERVSDADPNTEKPDAFILNYCLDKRTQRIIARLQSDFRMTDKYVRFTMYEKPFIDELKPTPVTTPSTLHGRFKCLFTDLSGEKDINAQNVNLAMELEDGTEKEVLETLTAEVTNEFCNPRF